MHLSDRSRYSTHHERALLTPVYRRTVLNIIHAVNGMKNYMVAQTDSGP